MNIISKLSEIINNALYKLERKILLTPEQWYRLIRLNRCELRRCFPHQKTYDLCLKCVKEDGEALQFVPKKFRTDEICIEALKQNIKAFEYIKNPSEQVLNFYNLYNL